MTRHGEPGDIDRRNVGAFISEHAYVATAYVERVGITRGAGNGGDASGRKLFHDSREKRIVGYRHNQSRGEGTRDAAHNGRQGRVDILKRQ